MALPGIGANKVAHHLQLLLWPQHGCRVSQTVNLRLGLAGEHNAQPAIIPESLRRPFPAAFLCGLSTQFGHKACSCKALRWAFLASETYMAVVERSAYTIVSWTVLRSVPRAT